MKEEKEIGEDEFFGLIFLEILLAKVAGSMSPGCCLNLVAGVDVVAQEEELPLADVGAGQLWEGEEGASGMMVVGGEGAGDVRSQSPILSLFDC